MPAYPMPDWLGPQPEFGRLFAEGARMGSEIKQQQNRLQQASAMAEMNVQAEQAAADRAEKFRQQQLLTQKAYHDQMISMQQSKLQQAEQRLQQSVSTAAKAYQARQQYQARVAQLTDGGMDEREAQMQAFREVGPSMGTIPGGFGAALRPDRAAAGASSDKKFEYTQAARAFRDKWSAEAPIMERAMRSDQAKLPDSMKDRIKDYQKDKEDLQDMMSGITGKAVAPSTGTNGGGKTVKVGNYTVTVPQDDEDATAVISGE